MSQTIVTTGLDQQMKKSFSHWFILSAGAILAITGIAKIWSGLGNSKFLAVVDPIIGIKFGQLMLAVATVEISIALICFFNKKQTMVLALVAWLSTTFLFYRIGMWWMNWKSPCGCLGNLTDALHISPQTADGIMKAVLAYLLIGSYFLLIRQWLQKRPVDNSRELAALQ